MCFERVGRLAGKNPYTSNYANISQISLLFFLKDRIVCTYVVQSSKQMSKAMCNPSQFAFFEQNSVSSSFTY